MAIDVTRYAYKVFSQRGEDGIIECIFNTLGIEQGWCCELGAWDGIHLSNVRNLIIKGWHGVLIEPDPDKFSQLEWNTREFPGVYCRKTKVGLESHNRLNKILSTTPIPEDFDLLSLDIDSYDYWIWSSLTYDPKVVVVEYNPSWHGRVTIPYNPRGSKFDYTQYYGASAEAMISLGKVKGYNLVGVVPYTNLFFVKKGVSKGRFRTVNLSKKQHLSTSHLKPMTQAQKDSLIYNPPYRWEEV